MEKKLTSMSLDFTGAQWISARDANEKNSFVRLRRSFCLKEQPSSRKLFVTAESYYALYVNGIFVQRGPIRGTCNLHFYDEIDIAPWLHVGENTLALLIHSPGYENFIASPGARIPALLLKSEDLVSDTTWEAQKGAEWKPNTVFFSMQTGYREERDLRLAPVDELWTRGMDDPYQWQNAVVAELKQKKQLEKRNIPPLLERTILPVALARQYELDLSGEAPEGDIGPWLDQAFWNPLPPPRLQNAASLTTASPACTIQPGKPVALLLDYGQDYTLFPEIELECQAAGTRVALIYGEAIIETGRLRLILPDSYTFTDLYTLRQGRNAIGSPLVERGGRYLMVVLWNITAPVTITKAVWKEHRYAAAHRADFHCSDEQLNHLWNLCVETLHVNMTDTFTDCPWRERAFWVNDLVVENRTSLAAFGALPLHRRSFQMAFSQQRADGWVPGVCPAPNIPEMKWVLPATNLFLFEMLQDYLQCSGDWEGIRPYLVPLERILTAVEKETDANGSVAAPMGSWNFYDWGYCFRDIDFCNQRESMFNSLYCQALRIYIGFLRHLEPQRDTAAYEARLERTRKALQEHFVDAKTGLFADAYSYYHYHKDAPKCRGKIITQLGQAMALQAGVVPEGEEQCFAQALIQPEYPMPDIYLHSYVIRQMHRHHLDRQALDRIRKYWGRVLDDGAKTLYEQAIVKFGHDWQFCGNNGSLCHGFGTCPVEFMQTAILGVEPVAPGYAEFRFDPRPADLQFAEGRVPTPFGEIFASWKKSENGLTCELTVPAGTTAILPNGERRSTGCHIIQL